MRLAPCTAFGPTTVTVNIDGTPIVTARFRGYQPIIGDQVVLLLQAGAWLALGAIPLAAPSATGVATSTSLPGVAAYNQTGYVDIPNGTLTHIKARPDSGLLVEITASGWASTAGIRVDLAVFAGKLDQRITQFFFNTAGEHHLFTAPGLSPGSTPEYTPSAAGCGSAPASSTPPPTTSTACPCRR